MVQRAVKVRLHSVHNAVMLPARGQLMPHFRCLHEQISESEKNFF